MNRIVARYLDGHLVKGSTSDFNPMKESFHVSSGAGTKPIKVFITELKALFFVRDLEGNAAHQEKKEFDPKKPSVGRKIQVEFRDGEVLVGTTQAYQPERPGFFLVPADGTSNNERCFVPTSAIKRVLFV
jgi:hypothetical protein